MYQSMYKIASLRVFGWCRPGHFVALLSSFHLRLCPFSLSLEKKGEGESSETVSSCCHLVTWNSSQRFDTATVYAEKVD